MMSLACSDLPIVILAAGQSRRMRGTDKLMETVEGQPLIRRQAAIARKSTTGPVLIALPPAPHPRHDAVAGLGATPVPVPQAAEGMGASLRTAFAALPAGVPAAMLMLADLPDLTAEDLCRVFDAVDLSSQVQVWRGATADGAPGHPIVFSAALFPDLAGLAGDTGGRDVIAAAGNKVQLVPLPDQHALRDLDTPEDWARWRAGQAVAER